MTETSLGPVCICRTAGCEDECQHPACLNPACFCAAAPREYVDDFHWHASAGMAGSCSCDIDGEAPS